MKRLEKIILCLTLFLPIHLMANEIKLEYPELMVTPRASERLQIEALKEKQNTWATELPFKISGTTTLLAGIFMLSDVDETKDTKKVSPLAGIVAGAGFLGLSIYLTSSYRPYQSAYTEVRRYKKSTERSQLIRERLAEEHINNIARLGKRLKWLSFIVNGGVSAYMLSQATSKSTGQVFAALAMATSLGPIIFPHHWPEVAKEQKNYKKKIYGPLINATLLKVPGKNDLVPGALFTYSF